MDSTPASLLDRMRHPTEDAWRQFVHLYTPLLCHWARRLGLSDNDADDLVQEVFALLVRKLPQFTYDRDRSFRKWLGTVLLNHWRDRQRKYTPTLVQAPSGKPTEPSDVDDAEVYAEVEFRRHLVGRAVQIMRAEFNETTWRAFWEFVACSRSAAEVARELHISENAVYIAKCRVLRRLREELAGMMD